MTLTATHCLNCKAKITAEGTRYCPFCGTVLPETAANRPLSLDERFAAIENHPELPKLMRLRPSTVGHSLSNIAIVIFAIGFVAMAFFVMLMFRQAASTMNAGPFNLVTIIPFVVVGFGAVVLVRALSKATKFAGSSMDRTIMRIIDERSHVSGGVGEHSRAHTSYYVTLETKTGHRREFATEGRLAGKVAPDDIGVAYVKGDTLVDFRRLRA